MNKDKLEAMIPTETARKYVLETGYTFTDWQKAALLFHHAKPLTEQLARLRALRDETSDDVLRDQISAYLNREEQAIATFRSNADGNYVYAIRIQDPNENAPFSDMIPEAYFADWKIAFEYGRGVGYSFEIAKYQICTGRTVDALNHASDKEDIRHGASCETGRLGFDESGTLIYLASSEVPSEVDCDKGVEWRSNFQEIFCEVPNPFDRGDIVKNISMGDYGIVGTAQEDWKAWLADESRGKYDTYSDIFIGVAYLQDDGSFVYGQANPLNLEQYQPETDLERGSALDDLLLCARELYSGRESFEALYYFQERYRKAKETESEGD